jgi:hypothetical protein
MTAEEERIQDRRAECDRILDDINRTADEMKLINDVFGITDCPDSSDSPDPDRADPPEEDARARSRESQLTAEEQAAINELMKELERSLSDDDRTKATHHD